MRDASLVVGFVAIGRNEGERLKRCLASLMREGERIVYVDSGSTDGSVDFARNLGIEVVALDMSRPFTAARARNAGFERLKTCWPDIAFIMFIDGDCELADGWIGEGAAFLNQHEDYAVASGRLRERNPEASVYNRLCDREWDTPAGEALACGGIALIRRSALDEAGGYDADLVAGEEPELCVRLRERGWRVFRLDADMAMHDAAMTRFGQWWRRMARGGYAFAEVSALHRRSEQRIWAKETVRAVVWALVAPAAILAAILVHPAALLLLLVYPLQMARIALREWPRAGRDALAFGFFNTVGKFAEATGAARYWASGRRSASGPVESGE